MQRESLGMAISASLREPILRYSEWAFASPLNGAISFLIVAAAVVIAALAWSKVAWPLLKLVTFPVWGPIRRRRRISLIRQAIQDPRANGMAAVRVLNQLTGYWGLKSQVDVQAAEAKGEISEKGKDLPVRYPARFYLLRVPRGLVGEVKALMHSLGREEGWIFLNSRKGGKAELINTHVGYRL
jgi:hypothetical protein